MRPKVVLAVLLVAVGVLTIATLISIGIRQSTAARRPTESGNSAPGVSTIKQTSAETAPPPLTESLVSSPLLAVQPGAELSDTNRAERVQKRNAELMALAMNNDSASMETILSELHNPDRQIRKGALEATIQFDDRAAVPRLKEIAAQTEDEDEKAEILEAADYINLPSITEYLAQQQAQREALGITNAPLRPRTNRSTGNPHPRPRPQPLAPAQPQAAP